MADDGMLMNFELGNAVLAPKTTFRGGHWKDRLRAKKGAKRRQKFAQGSFREDFKPQGTLTERPYKRQKFSGETKIANGAPPKDRENKKEVISSLFTFNPVSTTVDAPKEADKPESVQPSNAPLVDGIDTFTSLGVSAQLAAHLLTKLELKAPTAIQKAAIEPLLQEDADAFLQAETGSGKTLAYLLPILQRIMNMSEAEEKKVYRDSGLFAIILAPTRELSKQISVVLESLLRCANWLVSGTVIGGEKKKSEKARLRKGLNILVATPGRLADHIDNTQVLDVSRVRWLVLDEGDRLMELGFEDDIKRIVAMLDRKSRPMNSIKGLPSRRVTILCSATMKMNVQKLGEISLKDAAHIKADSVEQKPETSAEPQKEKFSAPAQLKQSYVVVPPKQRLVALVAFLKHAFMRRGSVKKAIVFLSCADTVDFHFLALARDYSEGQDNTADGFSKLLSQGVTTAMARSIKSTATPNPMLFRLHGSLPQALRTSTLAQFSRSSQPSVLLCTDVASRGLDLPSIDLVVEYDPAFSSEEHLHRIGRTARAGREGRAAVFLMPGPEEGYVDVLRAGYRDPAAAAVTRSDADEVLRKGFAPDVAKSSEENVKKSSASTRNWDDAATDFQLAVERWVIGSPAMAELAKKAYVSHVRAYATHIVAERKYFDVKSLHLGHFAKAFALREKPGSMGRGSASSGKERRKISNAANDDKRRTSNAIDDVSEAVDRNEAKRKMRVAMKMQMGAANEFNIG